MNHLLFGATGLIGSELSNIIPANDLLITVTRKPNPLVRTNYQNFICDMSEQSLLQLNLPLAIDTAYCCIGTTIKIAGSSEKFYSIDHDLVVNIAKLANQLKIKKLIVISSLGSNPNSSVFYNRTKGEMERDVTIAASSISQVIFLRPSLLLGDRSILGQPKRMGEQLAMQLTPFLTQVLCGPLKKYRPIPATTVAKKLLSLSKANDHSNRLLILENHELFQE